MGRIIFLCPYARTDISGGIKTTYRHAEMLRSLGFDSWVHQPEGPPSWFRSDAKLIARLTETAGDVLVFPETLNGPLLEMAQTPTPARKILYCQNQYYMAMNPIPAERLPELGFSAFAASSRSSRTFLESVLRLPDVAAIPCHVDPDIFRPLEKVMQVALVPRKMPREAALIRNVLQSKYPRLRSLPWQAIDNVSEQETAAILGRSAIFVALGYFESLGLVPLEAMAAGCLVTGFDGYGGREYATPANGFWLPPDHVEEVADAIALIVSGLERGDPALLAMRKEGAATAARYNKERTREALSQFYGRFA